jgi:hypothetical protein
MTTTKATHEGEELTVTFINYRPASDTLDFVEIDEVVILGCAVDHTAWPADLKRKIHALAYDLDFE